MKDRFLAASVKFGLTISLKKTKLMYTPTPGESNDELNIFGNGIRLGFVDTFVYLGSVIARERKLDSEILRRIQKASTTFDKLQKRVLLGRTERTSHVSLLYCTPQKHGQHIGDI